MIFKKRLCTLKGFTLTELITVVVILGTLLALAIPNYRWQIRRVINDEAKRILLRVYEGQIMHERDTGAYLVTASTIVINNVLGVEIPASGAMADLKHFDSLVVYNAVATTQNCGGPQGVLVSLSAIDVSLGAYEIYITDRGEFFCWDTAANDCETELCSKMGFNVL